MSKNIDDVVEGEIQRLMFSLYHEPMPEYEWTEAKINELLRTAKEQGRVEENERCAKIAEEQKRICGSSTSRQSTCDDIAFNIRKAKEKA